MASNKNQHFVPRCYLRPFTVDGADAAIHLYNIDRQKVIERASLKHQCSGDYFYGRDPDLERAIQWIESAYAAALRGVSSSEYALTDEQRNVLKIFWLLQHLRTEAASRRSVEMAELTRSVVGLEDPNFRLEIREAVQIAMKVFAESLHVVADLKVCLVRNRTTTPFVTSDDPAVLTNRWYLESAASTGESFGIHSAGTVLLLPLSPRLLCLGYDGDVYSVPHENGWTQARRNSDVDAFNQHQFLNCRANIFLQDAAHGKLVHDSFLQAAPSRPTQRHLIHYAVLDRPESGFSRYKVVKREEAGEHKEAIIHTQVVHAKPASWPRQVSWRAKGFVFTNGTGVGYVRQADINSYGGPPFRKVRI